MMALLRELNKLTKRRGDQARPFLISAQGELACADVLARDPIARNIQPGDVVALVGDFDAHSIRRLLTLLDARCIVMPLMAATRPQHQYFLEAGHANVLIEEGSLLRLPDRAPPHPHLTQLREKGHPGLILFSSGTTGSPKAVLHDFQRFLIRYRTPRPALRTLNFLLFDHIGGVNTLLHTLFNSGIVIFPRSRQVADVLDDIVDFEVELLPTTPTFLRMMMLSGILENRHLPSLRVVTYGTERMDQPTLSRLSEHMPRVDFRQTYGMSELGILRVKSVARDSLWMWVDGEGVETRIANGILQIRSENRMVGYLNAPSPFDKDGWYDTKDLVEGQPDGSIRIVGRQSDWINVGGEKVLPAIIEKAALEHSCVLHAKAIGIDNPITGQHIELNVELVPGHTMATRELRAWLVQRLPASFLPQRIRFDQLAVSHRFKKV